MVLVAMMVLLLVVQIVVVQSVDVVVVQQDVAVPLEQDPVLAVDDHAAAAADRPSAHLEELGRGIRREHKVLVGAHKHVDQREGSGQDRAVGHDR